MSTLERLPPSVVFPQPVTVDVSPAWTKESTRGLVAGGMMATALFSTAGDVSRSRAMSLSLMFGIIAGMDNDLDNVVHLFCAIVDVCAIFAQAYFDLAGWEGITVLVEHTVGRGHHPPWWIRLPPHW